MNDLPDYREPTEIEMVLIPVLIEAVGAILLVVVLATPVPI